MVSILNLPGLHAPRQFGQLRDGSLTWSFMPEVLEIFVRLATNSKLLKGIEPANRAFA